MTRDVVGPREAAVAALAEEIHRVLLGFDEPIDKHWTDGADPYCVRWATRIVDHANPAAKAALAAWLDDDAHDHHYDPRCAVCVESATPISSEAPSAGVTPEAPRLDVAALNRHTAELATLGQRLSHFATPSTSTETPTRVVGGGETGYHAGHDVCVDIQTQADMAEAYYKTLETHLREHGCDHDFAEVANENGSLATTPSVSDEGLVLPPGVEAWVEVAAAALDRGGAVDWDDAQRIAEDVATKLWNYLSEGLISGPGVLNREPDR